MTALVHPFTKAELAEFERAKRVVSDALEAEGVADKKLIAAGRALEEIRTAKWYVQTHKTFEAFCRDTWGRGRRHVNLWIAAGKVAKNLGSRDPTDQLTEKAARPLVRLEPKQQVQAWQAALKAAGNKPVTAAIVKRAAETVAPRAKPRATPRGVAKDVQAALAALDKLDETERRHFLWIAGLADIEVFDPSRDVTRRAAVGFAILGLPDSATESDVRRVQKEAARVAHPDRGGTQEAFARITQAARDVLEWFAEKV